MEVQLTLTAALRSNGNSTSLLHCWVATTSIVWIQNSRFLLLWPSSLATRMASTVVLIATEISNLLFNVVKWFPISDIVDRNAPMSISHIRCWNGSESLLASGIPELKFKGFIVNFDHFYFEIDTNGTGLILIKNVIGELQKQRCFATAHITDHDDFILGFNLLGLNSLWLKGIPWSYALISLCLSWNQCYVIVIIITIIFFYSTQSTEHELLFCSPRLNFSTRILFNLFFN